MAAFPTTVATDSDLYIAVNATATQLTDNPLTNVATTVNVVSTAAFPTVGFISIDTEIIKYTGKTGTSFTGCTRGADGTTAASHLQNAQVFHNVIAAHHNALKDDLIATEQFISDLIGRTNTQIKTPSGSAGNPSHSFSTDTASGMYLVAANQVGFSVSSSLKMRITTAGVNVDAGGLFINAGVIQNTNGSAASPAYSFTADTDTGWYGLSDNSIRAGIGGTQRFIFDSSSLTIVNDVARLSLLRTTNGRNPYEEILNSQGGIRYHGANNGAGESTTIAHQFQSDSPSAGTIILQMLGNGQVLYTDGTLSLPSIAFINDTDTGLYRAGSNNIKIVAGGTEYIQCSGTINQFLVQSYFTDGTQALPGITFINDGDTGIYRSGSNTLDVSAGNVHVAAFSNNGVGQIQASDGSSAAPAFSFINDTDTGIRRANTNQWNAVAGGTDVMYFISTGAGPLTNDAESFGQTGQRWQNIYGSRLVDVSGALSGSGVQILSYNTSNTAGSFASIVTEVAGGTALDPYFASIVDGGGIWSFGTDNSDSDAFVLTNAITLNGSNLLRVTTTGGAQIKGTATNDNATSGFVGELVESVVSSFTNTAASTNFSDLTSISLPAGDWDVYGAVEYFVNTATWTATDTGISSTSGNSATGLVRGDNRLQQAWASTSTVTAQSVTTLPVQRVSISGTTTYYLKIKATFSAGQPQAIGTLRARRRR